MYFRWDIRGLKSILAMQCEECYIYYLSFLMSSFNIAASQVFNLMMSKVIPSQINHAGKFLFELLRYIYMIKLKLTEETKQLFVFFQR